MGGVVFTPIVELLIVHFGGQSVGEQSAFVVLSVVFLVVCSIGSIFMVNPPDGYKIDATKTAATNGSSYHTTSQMLKTPQFYLLTFTLLLACMGGLMMIAFARPIAEASPRLAATATIGVLAINLSNACGRLFWGIISDKLGRINTILVLLTGTAILALMINLVVESYLLYGLIACIGFFYGGILSNFPSLTADMFGAKHMATNYGVILLGFGAGAIISSQIAGYYRDVAQTAGDINRMFPAFVIASCCTAVGILMMIALKVISRKRD
jgi:OFA family oxalate/formate antiporter-like MFS transporter